MGRRSRGRKRSKNRKRKRERYEDSDDGKVVRVAATDAGAPATAPREGDVRVRLDVFDLEVAKGHDGLLRGMPEPVVVLAAWLVGARGALLVGRQLVRFETPQRLPQTLAVPERMRLEARLPGGPSSTLLVVVAAIEEDAGTGVQEVYAAMERSRDLSLLWSDGDHPHGGPLDEFTRSASSDLRLPHAIHVELDGRDLADRVDGDDWIAASACVTACGSGSRRTLRFPLRAADGKNDWTLRTALEVRP